MGNLVINDEMTKGFSYPYDCQYVPKVTVVKNESGTVKDSFMHGTDYDWARVTLNFSQMDATERIEFFDFIRRVGGAYDSFLLRDDFGMGYIVPTYTAVASHGAETNFQLIETVDEKTYDRKNIVATSEVIKYAGVLQVLDTDYSIVNVNSGIVTYINPPAGAEAVTASFQFYRRMRFLNDANLRVAMRSYENSTGILIMEEEFA